MTTLYATTLTLSIIIGILFILFFILMIMSSKGTISDDPIFLIIAFFILMTVLYVIYVPLSLSSLM